MAGIVEPHAGAALSRRPVGERLRLGAFHVGFVAASKNRPGGAPSCCAHGDGAALGPLANVQEFQAVIVHGGRCVLSAAAGRATANSRNQVLRPAWPNRVNADAHIAHCR